ncbi:MAG: hypothetical protein ACI9SG_001201, partial [Maribacter sp.]
MYPFVLSRLYTVEHQLKHTLFMELTNEELMATVSDGNLD